MANVNRNRSIDVLKCISMMFVVGLHYNLHCGFKIFPSMNAGFVITWVSEAIYYTAVNIFVLISGYLGRSKDRNITRIITLWLQTFTYSIFFLLAFLHTKPLKIQIIQSVLPVSTGHYWFITSYIFLMCIQPGLLYIYENKKLYNKLLIILVFLCSVLPTLNPFAAPDFFMEGGMRIGWMVTLYLTGMNLDKIKETLEGKKKLVLLCFALLIAIGTKLMVSLVKKDSGAVFYHNNSLFIFIASVVIVEAFIDVRINTRIDSFITALAKSSVAVYLISENIFVKDALWNAVNKLLIGAKWYNAFFCSITIIIGVFFTCSLVDIVRQRVFGKVSQSIVLRVQMKIVRITSILENYSRGGG